MKNLGAAGFSLLLLGLVNYILPEFLNLPYWFNHLTHFTGGLLVGWLFGAFWVMVLTRLCIIDLKARYAIISSFIFLSSIAIGAFWEEYEFYVIGPETLANWTLLPLYIDTMLDMKMNRWGGTAAWAIYSVYTLVHAMLRQSRT